MTKYIIEGVHDIKVDTNKYETEITFKNYQGETAIIELARKDAELLLERLQETMQS